MVDSLPGWEVVRQESPSAAALDDVEDSVEDLLRAMEPGASVVVGGRQMIFEASPFDIR
jgi:hypothetical protein